MTAEKPRIIAARVLARCSGTEFVEDLLEQALTASRLSSADRHLCQELVYGVVRWRAALDWLIARKTNGRQQKAALQDLLRLGLYQIFWLQRIPNHAAVDETVEMAKRAGLGPQSGFVNALLRGYLREFDATRQLLVELPATQPALAYSHPDWLAARWTARWGPDQAARLMTWNNTVPKTFARVNTLRAEPAKLLIQWRDEAVDYDFFRRDWFDENLVFELKSHPPLHRLSSFQQGLFYIQDPSTLLSVRELAPQCGETILDLCAAPGGKLTYIAQLIKNDGTLLAHDVAPDRLKLIEENCARLGVTCARPFAGWSATRPFDRLLIDAPCSNTGVMRRRVDLRWRIRPEEIQRLRLSQLDLLRQAAPRLRPGGTLLYSTCSLEPEENTEVIEQFLSEYSDFKLESQRELLPFIDDVDGAYVACLLKTR